MTLFELTGDGASRVYFAAAGADTEALDQLRAAGTASGPFELRQLGGETCWMRPSADGRLRAIDPENRDWQPSHGVPLSALIFCGRQARSTPLVYEARSWRQGVYVAATLMREASGTSWATHDPMAMLSRCGYNMGDYFAHWLSIGRKLQEAPKFFHINWFRSDGAGPLWPGGAENIRVLRWIAGRLDETQGGRESPVGITPEADSLDRNGLAMSSERLEHALSCNHGALLIQAEAARRYLAKFGDTLPPPLLMEHRHLVRRLQESLH